MNFAFIMPVLCIEQHLLSVPMHSRYLCLPALCTQSAMWYETQSKKFDNFKYMHVCKWDSIYTVYVSVCVRAVIFPCELRWFCAVAFTYSFFFSPAPHPPVWPSRPPTQPLTQRAMFPTQFPMGYESYSVEQQQGVYVCVCLCGGTRCGCVISLTWQCKSHVVWSTLVHLTSGQCSNTKPQTC